MTFDEVLQLVVKAVADLFDTPEGQQLIKDLIAYIDAVTSGNQPPARPSVTPPFIGNPANVSPNPQNPTHR